MHRVAMVRAGGGPSAAKVMSPSTWTTSARWRAASRTMARRGSSPVLSRGAMASATSTWPRSASRTNAKLCSMEWLRTARGRRW
jgi:hypothetical protein